MTMCPTKAIKAAAERKLRNNYHYRLCLATCGLVCATVLAGCGGSPAPKRASGLSAAPSSSLHAMLPSSFQASGIIRVGVNAITPPFDYQVNGKFTGIEAAMRAVIARELSVQFDPTVIVPFSALLPALLSGREDIIMGEMTDTAAREKVVNFVDYMNIGYGLLVGGGNPDHIQSMADLCGLSFGAVIGTIPANIANAQSKRCVAAGRKGITIVPFPSNGPMVVGVESGRIQATVNDYPTMVYVAQQSAGKLEVVGRPFDVSPYGIAVRKSDPQLAKALQAALQDGINSGVIQKAIAPYGVTSELPTKVVINGGS